MADQLSFRWTQRKRAADQSVADSGSYSESASSDVTMQRKRRRLQPMTDDELLSVIVSEPQRQGWLALPSQHRPRNEAVRTALREALSSYLTDSQLSFVVDDVADYLYSSLHSTFVPQLQTQHDLSPLQSKWGGLPFLFTNEPWPQCENGHPIDFLFQLRQSDYPAVLRHSAWVRPSATDSDEQVGPLLFQFFCCSFCESLHSDSLLHDSHALQHCTSVLQLGEEEEAESGEVAAQSSRALPDAIHANNSDHSCLMRVIDPRAGPHRTAADIASFPEVIRWQLLRPRYTECGLAGWQEHKDYPSSQQDVDDLLSCCAPQRRPALRRALDGYGSHLIDTVTLQADRMGGWAWWDDDTQYTHCPLNGCNRRLVFFYQTWYRPPDEAQGCIGVITQCSVHRHIFHFSWGRGYMT